MSLLFLPDFFKKSAAELTSARTEGRETFLRKSPELRHRTESWD